MSGFTKSESTQSESNQSTSLAKKKILSPASNVGYPIAIKNPANSGVKQFINVLNPFSKQPIVVRPRSEGPEFKKSLHRYYYEGAIDLTEVKFK